MSRSCIIIVAHVQNSCIRVALITALWSWNTYVFW